LRGIEKQGRRTLTLYWKEKAAAATTFQGGAARFSGGDRRDPAGGAKIR
jgi:hypothetical protein